MTEASQLNQGTELSDAAWQVDRFVRRFERGDRAEPGYRERSDRAEPGYRELARYAAMPLVLTPELLGYLRVEFLRGQVDWIAEADLLLSDLCRPVGYEQYVLQPEVRALLLAELEAAHPADLERAATVLIQYLRQLARTNPYFGPREQQPQAWSAMLYIAAERQKVADEIAAEFERVGAGVGEWVMSSSARREMKHFAKIVQDLAPRLGDPHLVAYAQRVTQVLKEPRSIAPQDLHRIYQVGDRVLPALTQLIAPVMPTGFPGFPPLQQFDFEVLEFAEGQPQVTLPKPLQRVRHEFHVATIVFTQKVQPKRPELSIQRTFRQDWQYVDTLPDDVSLELV
ncbi:MAG: hypothetical protein VKJ24_15215, partial [Synechococcales bacterium]|nr:hypothetical protein [Synechococcales bacterium]